MRYSVMRLLCMFDLPVETATERRAYRTFRNYLMKEGFVMLQYSVYMRTCPHRDYVCALEKRIRKHIPVSGNIRLITITEKQYEKYEIRFERVTQLCGKNIIKKAFIIDSFLKHFSNYKYAEYENYMIENISLDGIIPGRNYYKVLHVSSRTDLLEELKVKKSGLVRTCIGHILNGFNYQSDINKIREIMIPMYNGINEQFIHGNSCLKVTSSEKDILEMLLQCNLSYGNEEKSLGEVSTIDLLTSYLNLLVQVQEFEGDKVLLILENIDHMLTKCEFKKLMRELKLAVTKSDLWCIVTSSLEGYCDIDPKWFAGINCVNDIIYQMPEYEELKAYVEYNYPIYVELDTDDLDDMLTGAIHDIGINNSEHNIKSYILEQIVNMSECVSMRRKKKLTTPEINFLCQ